MPVPNRIHNLVYIMVPAVNREPTQELVRAGLIACRTAREMKLIPIFPWLYYRPFMSDEEIGKELARESLRWAKRVSKIWVCWMDDDWTRIVLDPVAHRILIESEGLLAGVPRPFESRHRLTVHRFYQGKDGNPQVRHMDRIDTAALLRCNVVSGLLHGVTA